jgi:hypothetical protein
VRGTKTPKRTGYIRQYIASFFAGLRMAMSPCHAKEAEVLTGKTSTASGPGISIGLPDVLGVAIDQTGTKCAPQTRTKMPPDANIRPTAVRGNC